jgi:glycosyltransferase involved in cell wall biosynthesis
MQEFNRPLISILTPSFNQGRYIEQTITSILKQDYARFEHIVIDGGSTDETIEVLKRYPHVKWISEPDKGQADALNKGFRMATGDLIGWINSDDFYAEGVFQRVADIFGDQSVQWTIGDVVDYYDGTGTESYVSSETITYQALIRNPDILRQQGAFFRSEFIRKAGGWNAEFYMVMDFDIWLRMARLSAPLMTHEKTAFFRMHEEQKTQLRNLLRQSKEIDCILIDHGASLLDRFRNRFKKRRLWATMTAIHILSSAGLLAPRHRLS